LHLDLQILHGWTQRRFEYSLFRIGTPFASLFRGIEKGAAEMRNRSCVNILIGCVLVALAIPTWAQRGPGSGSQRANNRGMCMAMINTIVKQSLDATETAGLAYMLEEEKLAHDVYAKLHAKWGLRIFGNISQGEERHAESIKLLLDRYGLRDPAAINSIGIFQNDGLQALYADLIRQGETSLPAALRVGATMEEMNIRNLEKAVASTDNDDLKLVYGNLLGASKNHIQMFVGQLEAAGDSYSAQYIGQAALSSILSGSRTAGPGYSMRGNGRGRMGRGNSGICPWAQP
jgi:hypothetical protein